MAKSKITQYVDLVSPFSYMAFYVLKTSPAFRECEIDFVPVFLGAVMQATGNQPPLRIKNKDIWIEKERQRWAERFGIPFAEEGLPEGFPNRTLEAQRCLCVVKRDHTSEYLDVLSTLSTIYWVKRQKISDLSVVESGLRAVLGAEAANDVMHKITNPEVKNLLTRNTEDAIQNGAFGLPYFVATNAAGNVETFWGFDHLGQLIDFLDLSRPRESMEKGWRAML